mgnify:CR=1 FL=1
MAHRGEEIGEKMINPALYLIPVPLGDTAISAVLPDHNHDIVVAIKHFIVENIRSARRFLKKVDKTIDIDTLTFYELNEHTEQKDIGNYLDALAQGEPMGVISEAGCPGVADPGAMVVEMAHRKNLKVVPLSGPSSIIMAVMASGFNGQNFAFNGYLPAKPAERNSKIKQLESRIYKESQSQIFIEAPYRNTKMIQSLLASCRGDTMLCIASGITTEVEWIKTKSIAQWKKEKIPEIDKIPTIFILYR